MQLYVFYRLLLLSTFGLACFVAICPSSSRDLRETEHVLSRRTGGGSQCEHRLELKAAAEMEEDGSEGRLRMSHAIPSGLLLVRSTFEYLLPSMVGLHFRLDHSSCIGGYLISWLILHARGLLASNVKTRLHAA